MPMAKHLWDSLSENQHRALVTLARVDPTGVGVACAVSGPFSGTTMNSLRGHGLVTIETRGRARYAMLTEHGKSYVQSRGNK